MHAITTVEFEQQLVEVNNQFHINSKIKENLENETKVFLEKNTTIEDNIKILHDTKMLLETLKIHKLKEKKDFILNIVNTALIDIFQDNIRISIEPQESKGKVNTSGTQKFDIIFYQNDIELARNEELLISNGGGIMQVVSMLFKLLIGFIYSKNTFFLFDESFSQLSTDNRIRLSKFLQMFCKQYNFTIVVVSQVLDLDEYADIIYSVNAKYNNNGIRTLVLEDTMIKNDILSRNVFEGEEGYWKTSIKNFQSISNLELVFKGYTIIRGPNNSGKSAILRAISSILYNSFNVKKFPRKLGGLDSKGNPSKKVMESEIKLSKIHLHDTKSLPDPDSIPEEVSKEISLKYKTSKVSFIIEGEEYYGKNLAAEKLMEKIEELGFKYINLKEFYKNFKGNLKDQTERIASTTQYDGLFLVGAKGNETEKIFNFLFNTENITKAILKVKEELVLLAKDHENNQLRVLENTTKINIVTDTLNYYLKLYYFTVMNNLKIFDTVFLKNTLIGIDNNITDRNKIITIYQKNIILFNNEFLKISNSESYITQLKIKVAEIDKNLQDKNNKMKILNKAKIKFDKFYNDLEIINKGLYLRKKLDTELIDNKEKLKTIDIINRSYLLKKEVLDKLLKNNILNKYMNDYKTNFDNLKKLHVYIEPISNQIQNLKTVSNSLFTECSHCKGKGFILKGNKNGK